MQKNCSFSPVFREPSRSIFLFWSSSKHVQYQYNNSLMLITHLWYLRKEKTENKLRLAGSPQGPKILSYRSDLSQEMMHDT